MPGIRLFCYNSLGLAAGAPLLSLCGVGFALWCIRQRNPLFAHLVVGLAILRFSLPVEMEAILDVKMD